MFLEDQQKASVDKEVAITRTWREGKVAAPVQMAGEKQKTFLTGEREKPTLFGFPLYNPSEIRNDCA